MARVFVSHASEDGRLAGELREWLVGDGHSVFLDSDVRHGFVVGEEWEARLYERLRWADAVVCVVTAAFTTSAWCTAEVGICRSQGRPVLPLLAEPGAWHPLLAPTHHANYAEDPGAALAGLRVALQVLPQPGAGRRWWAPFHLGLVAAALVTLLLLARDTAPLSQIVPLASTVIGPGCATLDPNAHDDWDTHANWTPADSDYTGPQFSDRAVGLSNCTGQSFYILDELQTTALFRWHVTPATPRTELACDLWTYIPTKDAGDRQARYDFYADDGSGHLTWLGWPGHTIDQENTSGWTSLGRVAVPASANLLTIILDNQDATTQRWDTGAGDLAFHCIRQTG